MERHRMYFDTSESGETYDDHKLQTRYTNQLFYFNAVPKVWSIEVARNKPFFVLNGNKAYRSTIFENRTKSTIFTTFLYKLN